MQATDNVSRSITRLRKTEYGSAVLWPGANNLFPVKFEHGWDDWSVAAFQTPSSWTMPAPFGVALHHGTISVDLPEGLPLNEFREALGATLRRQRLDEVVRDRAWLEARNADLRDVLVLPRYTAAKKRDFKSIRPADLLVVDPLIDTERMLWIASAAVIAACGHAVAS
ncbi:hypothetical protein [Beijerinckia sp. L45]|uniref:hypothetical protein n=1 Tax=Beijerinckia sp. L45 TaxID=1641855 RepID=UPI00131B1F8A|nr:hypothetical protein [Beijerinckia sp. L45]